MTTGRAAVLLQRVCRFAAAESTNHLADAELLGRFVAQRDEAAFEALVRRHGPMVWGVCRRLLRDEHAAEDAFQAVFLVLVRKAASIRKHESVGSWLYGVALRLARRAKARASRQRACEGCEEHRASTDPVDEVTLREAQAILDEELARLPEKYRDPIILCCLEGLARDEAAARLGWPTTTLKSRLEAARALLRRRLSRRGLTLPGALAAALLAPAAVSPLVLASTCRTAALFAAGNAAVPPRVLALVEGAVHSVPPIRLKAIVVVLIMTLTAGAGLVISQAPAAKVPGTIASNGQPGTKQAQTATDPAHEALPEGALLRLGSTDFRHGKGIRNAALSPDGKLLATASFNSVMVWDLANRKRLQQFHFAHHDFGFVSPGLTFSPDGRHLGYVHGMEFACVWDLRTGKEVMHFKDNQRSLSCCRFSADGKLFALSDRERVRFYDLASKKETQAVPTQHLSDLSPDARTYVRVDEQKETLLGDTKTGKVMLRLEVAAAHNGIENGVAFTADGKRLALVDHIKKTVQIHTLPGGKVVARFPLPVSAWPKRPKERHGEYRLNFAADGTILYLATGRGLVHRWDLATGKELPRLKMQGNVTATFSLPDRQRIVTTGIDGLIRLWDARTGRELFEPKAYVGRTRAALSPDGRVVALADARGRLDLWDLAKGKLQRRLLAEGPAVTGLALSPDGKTVAATLVSGVLRLWDVPTGHARKTYRWEKGPDLARVSALLFSPNGRNLLVIDARAFSWLIGLPAGELRWKGPAARVATFMPDGASVALARWETQLVFVDVATGKERRRFSLGLQENPQLFHGIEAMARGPAGLQVALAPGDGRIALFDSRDGSRKKLFQAVDELPMKYLLLQRSRQRIQALAFSPDGRWLLTGGTDASVRLWETLTGKQVLRRNGHDGEIAYVAFAAGGHAAFSWGEDGQGYLWNLSPAPAPGPRPSVEALWESLAGTDAVAAYRAIWALAKDRAAVQLLQTKLQPVPKPDRARLTRLVADLSSQSFRVRDNATRELRKLGELAAPAMQEALKNRPPLEVQRRLEQLLNALRREPTAEEIRLVRAVQALERAGTAEARALLRSWAAGAGGGRLTEEARGALNRLGRMAK